MSQACTSLLSVYRGSSGAQQRTILGEASGQWFRQLCATAGRSCVGSGALRRRVPIHVEEHSVTTALQT
jgi:hypothetical protein